jgi:hypothetical protein
MVDDLLFHELLLLGPLWLCVIWCWRWSKRLAAPCQAHGQPVKRSQRHATHQKPFPGLTTKPSVPPVHTPSRHTRPSHLQPRHRC